MSTWRSFFRSVPHDPLFLRTTDKNNAPPPCSFNKYTQIASRAVRQGLKESERVAAEKRAQVGLKVQTWENGVGGEQVSFWCFLGFGKGGWGNWISLWIGLEWLLGSSTVDDERGSRWTYPMVRTGTGTVGRHLVTPAPTQNDRASPSTGHSNLHVSSPNNHSCILITLPFPASEIRRPSHRRRRRGR